MHEGLKCNLLGDPWMVGGGGSGRKWRGTDRAGENEQAG